MVGDETRTTQRENNQVHQTNDYLLRCRINIKLSDNVGICYRDSSNVINMSNKTPQQIYEETRGQNKIKIGSYFVLSEEELDELEDQEFAEKCEQEKWSNYYDNLGV